MSVGPSDRAELPTDSRRTRILELAEEYARAAWPPEPFVPGKTAVAVSGRVLGPAELRALVEAALDGWLTAGRFNREFEQRLATRLEIRHVLTTNSGSSASLLACSALTSSILGTRALHPGDEVITSAVGFPTTITPLLQYGLVPVFVDVEIPTYNVSASAIEAAVGPRTRAIVLAHTLGNPFAAEEIHAIARRHGLWLIEDCCDALGSTYRERPVGGFGDLGTLSFYPAHHITTGEGGAVITSSGKLRRIVESLRDWGRDCWCEPGRDGTCGRRFGWQLGDLPRGYDHKYTYRHAGYNLKLTDLQAALGVAQLGRLEEFVERRRLNFARLEAGLSELQEHLILPRATPDSRPAWFGFPLTVREGTSFGRDDLVRRLDECGVATRPLFAGNLVRQPFMRGQRYRVVGELSCADRILRGCFWLGVYPGLHEAQIDYMVECIRDAIVEWKG
ncbi:MAG: lipopolysaccharide biosynthesis protein RfbH [Myxococcota bacterium]